MISLRVGLTKAQVEAAGRLHARLEYWRSIDAALDGLKETLPLFDEMSCFVKAAAVNQFYGTNVYDLPRVGRHVVQIMKMPDRSDLVEDLGTVPNADGKPKRYISFASKFAHFFIDAERYPIVDSYAVRGLRRHLAGVRLPVDDPPIYAEYVLAHTSLIQLAELRCSGRELDRYLWLSGLYEAWSSSPDAKINVEVRNLFLCAPGDASVEDDMLLLRGRK